MKAGLFLLALAWFSGSAYAGYRLTERSFAWIDEPGLGLSESPTLTSTRLIDFGVAIPQELIEQAQDLSPQDVACLQAAAHTCLNK
jgi:hypothetical protein